MSFMSKLRTLRADQPPRILIYGPTKAGKTTLASEFPNPVFIQIEDGQNTSIEVDGWDRDDIQSYADVIAAMGELYENEHDYKTLVIDSTSELEKFVHVETCARGDDKGQRKHVEDFGYGKGYKLADTVWQEFLDYMNMLRKGRGMAIVLIAHVKIDRFDDPETVSYHRYELDLHDRAQKLIEKEMDALLLIKKGVAIKEEKRGSKEVRAHAEAVSTRFIHCESAPTSVSGSRYKLPAKIPYREGQGYAELAKYLPGQPAPVNPAKVAKAA